MNYTCLYGLIHLLLSAEKNKWSLRKFVVLRLPVGHTHVLLDAAWGLLAQLIYGKHSRRGDARRDVLDWESLHKCCQLVYGERLEVFEEIRGCYNFDEFVSLYRSNSVDAGISTHYGIELSVEDGVVKARSKPDIDPATRWSSPTQLFPPVLNPNLVARAPKDVPKTCALQEWNNVEDVKKDLTKFYTQQLSHRVVHIPDDVATGTIACVFAFTVCLCRPNTQQHTTRHVRLPREHRRSHACCPSVDRLVEKSSPNVSSSALYIRLCALFPFSSHLYVTCVQYPVV